MKLLDSFFNNIIIFNKVFFIILNIKVIFLIYFFLPHWQIVFIRKYSNTLTY